jgi:hypothetical protein
MNGLFAVDVPETMLKEYTVSFIKIIHVHADPNQVTRKVAFRLQDIEVKTARVFHSDHGIIPVGNFDPFFFMTPHKAKLLKKHDRLI